MTGMKLIVLVPSEVHAFILPLYILISLIDVKHALWYILCLTAQVSPSTAVDSWDNEKNYYNYGSNTCSPSKFCGHYTQVCRFGN